MQVSGKEEIGGVPILKVRDWMANDSIRSRSCLISRFCRWSPTQYKSPAYIEKRVSALLKALLEQGYIEPEEKLYPDERQFYMLTALGKEFSRASGAKRVKRETATQVLDGFMARVAEINSDPRFLVRVTRAVVYGSYVRGEETVGDLDLAVAYESKIISEERQRVYTEHFKASGRAYRAFGEEWLWPETEVNQFLKNRKRTISLHSFHDFQNMPKSANFTYEVLLGDPDQIKADIIEGERMEKEDQ